MTFRESLHSTLVDHYYRMDGEATRSEYWWFFVTYCLATILTGVVVAIVAIVTGLDLMLLTAWASILLPLALLLPMISLWVRRCRALGQSPAQSMGIFVGLFALSMMAPLGGLNPMAFDFGHWGLWLDYAFYGALIYSIWVGLRSRRGHARDQAAVPSDTP